MELNPVCGAEVALTGDERDFLSSLDRAVAELELAHTEECVLSPSHPGAHAVSPQGQLAEEQRSVVEWWLVWGTGSRAMLSYQDECDTPDPSWLDEGRGGCFLYPGHTGSSFRPPGYPLTDLSTYSYWAALESTLDCDFRSDRCARNAMRCFRSASFRSLRAVIFKMSLNYVFSI